MELFHAVNDTDSAKARSEIFARGLLDRVRFRNVFYDEVEADFRARGGTRLPALWDGEKLVQGLEEVMAKLGKLMMLACLALLGATTSGCATDVSTAEARAMVGKGALLVDLRTKAEYDERHAEGAVNMSSVELEQQMSQMPAERQVVLYCHTGARASVVTAKLRKKGYKNVHNLGSLGHWNTEHKQSSGF